MTLNVGASTSEYGSVVICDIPRLASNRTGALV